MKKFTKYILIGGTAFLAEYYVFVLILEVSQQILLAQIISWCIGYVVSFCGHRRITFRNKSDYKFSKSHQFILYGAVAMLTLIISTILVCILSITIAPAIAKIIIMVIMAIISYFMLNRLVFIRQ